MGMLINMRDWIDARFPMTKMWEEHLSKYYAPKNFNFWYFFGSLALLVLVIQIVSGIFLTMNFKPDAKEAFASVEYIMRDVEWGWLIRYIHSTGASAFFAVVYLHMFRAMLYGSYKGPRELIWIFGCLIYLALMAEAFFGYLLPWGQMSYWGAQVIISLFGAIPVIGDDLSVHILALHEVGSNNPDGIEIKKNKDENGIPKDGIPFHPYYTVKDIVGVVVFLMFFSVVVFFVPEGGGYFLEKPNFEPADPLKTPEHIAPVWYFTPYYAILRAVTIDIGPFTAKFLGVILMGAAVVILFFLPWLDRSPVKSIRYRGPIYKTMLALFVVAFVVLGWLGTEAPTGVKTLMAQIGTTVYFAFFLLMPFYTRIDKTKPVPERVTFK
jgi:ubiquinol-cytochrome c reductase cytochrome b subunit